MDQFHRLNRDEILIILSNLDSNGLYEMCNISEKLKGICTKKYRELFGHRFATEYPGFDINSVKPENLRIVYKEFADGLKRQSFIEFQWDFQSMDSIQIREETGRLANIQDAYLEILVNLYIPLDENKVHQIDVLYFSETDENPFADLVFRVKRNRPVTLIDIFQDIVSANNDEIIAQTKEYNQKIIDNLEGDDKLRAQNNLPAYESDLKLDVLTLIDIEKLNETFGYQAQNGIPKCFLKTIRT